MIETFKGPLGSHRNYITHIAFENWLDYMKAKMKHEEKGSSSTSDRYREFRLFLNAVDSFNNILDYLYYEYEDRIKPKDLRRFKQELRRKYPQFDELSELANAYKHCVRSRGREKNQDLLWARDLQEPKLTVSVELGQERPKVTADYEFPWPITKHELKLQRVFDFWRNYLDAGIVDEMITPDLKESAGELGSDLDI